MGSLLASAVTAFSGIISKLWYRVAPPASLARRASIVNRAKVLAATRFQAERRPAASARTGVATNVPTQPAASEIDRDWSNSKHSAAIGPLARRWRRAFRLPHSSARLQGACPRGGQQRARGLRLWPAAVGSRGQASVERWGAAAAGGGAAGHGPHPRGALAARSCGFFGPGPAVAKGRRFSRAPFGQSFPKSSRCGPTRPSRTRCPG